MENTKRGFEDKTNPKSKARNADHVRDMKAHIAKIITNYKDLYMQTLILRVEYKTNPKSNAPMKYKKLQRPNKVRLSSWPLL